MVLLVTGAMGHVGYEVAHQAAAEGPVIATFNDGFRTGDAEALGKDVTWASCDLADPAAVERLADEHPIDACIHLAAVSNEAYARPDPLAAVQSNVGAVANLLEAARRGNWRRFILVSTGSVFQTTDATTLLLEDTPVSVANVYGTTKRCAELLTRMYRTQFDLSASAVRISWVYGPPIVSDSPTRGPIPSFLKKALAGTAIRDPSGGDFAASFTYVGDAAAGLIATSRAPTLHHDIYHLGPGVNYTAREVGAAVCAAVSGAIIELGPGAEPWTTYTPLRGPLGGNRLREDTGFTVGHTLEEGVSAYAAWMRAHPETYR